MTRWSGILLSLVLSISLGCEKKPEPATNSGPRPIPGGAGKPAGAGFDEQVKDKTPGKR